MLFCFPAVRETQYEPFPALPQYEFPPIVTLRRLSPISDFVRRYLLSLAFGSIFPLHPGNIVVKLDSFAPRPHSLFKN